MYDTKGMRTNTRYNRTFQKLTGLRNSYVSKLKVFTAPSFVCSYTTVQALDPTYQPPTYYKDSSMEARIEVPAEMYPQYNFPGLILGPRGNHLKEMEKKYIVRIAIKGKGSIKEGMTGLRKDGSHWEVSRGFSLALYKPNSLFLRVPPSPCTSLSQASPALTGKK